MTIETKLKANGYTDKEIREKSKIFNKMKSAKEI